ncbi:MAG TPA: DUF481 domain-containing protein [Tepidisphaeraceae bacterium]|nr:DUF481 domain-containing protein [Tepidisphaeraceae bacterium]
MKRFVLAAATISILSVAALADQVQFTNGDRLTGTIEGVEAGKMTFNSKLAGKLTINLKDVKTFSSDGPISIKLNDGTVIHQVVSAGPAGQITLAPGGVLQPQNVPLSSVKFINYKEDWTGNIVAGGSLTRGNTDTDELSLAINMGRRTEKDRLTVDGGFLYGREKVPGLAGKHETENDWFIGGKYDYFFTPKFYGYVNARVERDLIAGISLRLTPGGGVGYDWFNQPDFHLHTEGGVSWLYREYVHDGGTEESVAVRLAYHLDKKLGKAVTLFHNVEYLPGLDSVNDYYIDADAGIRADISPRMFTEFKVREQYDSEPAPTKGHNDTRFILGVGLKF